MVVTPSAVRPTPPNNVARPGTLPIGLAGLPSSGTGKGLAELLAYVDLVNRSDKFFINDQLTETISFNKKEGKYLELPQIIFSR